MYVFFCFFVFHACVFTFYGQKTTRIINFPPRVGGLSARERKFSVLVEEEKWGRVSSRPLVCMHALQAFPLFACGVFEPPVKICSIVRQYSFRMYRETICNNIFQAFSLSFFAPTGVVGGKAAKNRSVDRDALAVFFSSSFPSQLFISSPFFCCAPTRTPQGVRGTSVRILHAEIWNIFIPETDFIYSCLMI